MAKLSGAFIKVLVDNNAGAAQDVSSDVDSVDIPDEYGELDVTGFGDGADNSIPGLPSFNVEMQGNFNSANNRLYNVLREIVGKRSASVTVTIQVGQNTAPVAGDPEFEGEFWCQKMNVAANPKGKVTLSASFKPMGAVAPAWGVVS